MLSINTIARVAVNVVRSASQPNTGALLMKGSSCAAARRLRSYATSTEAAGLIAECPNADES